jgi:hypothetical protein
MSGAMRPFPQYAFMAWCLVKHRDNFILLYYLYVQLLSNPISHEAQIKFIFHISAKRIPQTFFYFKRFFDVMYI